jgi:DNA mismatch endonuclease (patch repair protein)
MIDIVDARTRSRMMSAIKGKDSLPEILVRRHLFRGGLRFRLHVKGLPGRPDIVLRRFGAIVFVHGCFWHRHPHCRFATTPDTRQEFWLEKFKANVARDTAQMAQLEKLGWKVHVIWECESRDSARLDRLISDIRAESIDH